MEKYEKIKWTTADDYKVSSYYPHSLFFVSVMSKVSPVSPCILINYSLWLYPPVPYCIPCGCIPLYRTVSSVAVYPCTVLYPLWLYPTVPYTVSSVAVYPCTVLYSPSTLLMHWRSFEGHFLYILRC